MPRPKKYKLLSPGLPFRSIGELGLIGVVIVSGIMVLGIALAANSFFAVEVASGTLGGGSIIVNDSNSTSGKAIRFGVASTPVPTPAPTPTPPPPALGLYVDPNTLASAQAAAWATSDPSGAAEMRKISSEPIAEWLGDWNTNVQSSVASIVNAAAAAHSQPILVAYNIPNRDCGGYSSGGATDATYPNWISQFAAGIGNNQAIVILEPDALAGTSCLSAAEYQTRMSLLSSAVTVLKSHPGVKVYVDAGNAGWLAASDAASRLNQANIAAADGFSLNVSNFLTTAQSISYGQQVAGSIGNKHFVIDTSRNGLGGDGQWCNPPGRALGTRPTLSTGVALVDGYLWVKYPGSSDGTCNGGPSAGAWWAAYALGLAQNAAF